jgi:hypothetical protein
MSNSPSGSVLRDRFRRIYAKEYDGPIVTVVALALAGGVDAAGGLAAWKNPYPVPALINRATVDVITASSAACTIDVGEASAANILGTNLINGLSVASAGTHDNLTSPGTAGLPLAKVPVGGFVTVSTATGASAGLVANVYLELTQMKD